MVINFSRLIRPVVLCALISITTIGLAFAQTSADGNLQYIDPRIGNVGQLLEPTRPTMHLPNQMISMYPKEQIISTIRSSFPLNMVSHRLGEVFAIKPDNLPLTRCIWDQKMPYDHDLEVIHPGTILPIYR
jgi:hypothetical protein